MKTTYFWKAEREPIPGIKYISIAHNKDFIRMQSYDALIPSWDLINLVIENGYSNEILNIYKEAYYKQLMKLDPGKVYEDLHDCTLVCYESSKDIANHKKFCHRRMVAGWIEQELGIIIPEETRKCEDKLIIPAIYL